MKTIRNFLFINIVLASVAIFDTIATQLVDKYPVSIGEQGYRTLFDAVQVAPNKATIQIHQNMTIDQEIEIVNKAITIKPVGDIRLLRGYNYDGHLFKIAQGAFLTLETNIQNYQNRLVIDGDGKSHFIIGRDERQVYFDENAPKHIAEQQNYYHDYDHNVDVPIEESGQCYVKGDDGRKLYIDGIKRKIVMERIYKNTIGDGTDVIAKVQQKVFIDETNKENLQQFIVGGNVQKIPFNNEQVDGRFVVRQVDGCIIANYGKFMIDGNVILGNNYNNVAPIILSENGGLIVNGKVVTLNDMTDTIILQSSTHSYIYNKNVIYGAIYNKGEFTLLRGYIQENETNGVFNAEGAIFNMYYGSIFNNFAHQGAGVLNCGTFNLYGGEIHSNIAYYNGAGVYNNGTMNMFCGTIAKNKTDLYNISIDIQGGGYGGGIYNSQNGKLRITNGLIEGNCAVYGGGLYTAGILEMTNGSITKNIASFLLYARSTIYSVAQNFIEWQTYDYGNSRGKGGGVFNASNNIFLRGSITKNTAKFDNDICSE